MNKKLITIVWSFLKVFTFFCFLYASFIMFRLRNVTTASLILFSITSFIILNKIDSIDRKIMLLDTRIGQFEKEKKELNKLREKMDKELKRC